MMEILRPYSHGLALAGAGGGGFMLVVSQEPNMRLEFESLIAAARSHEDGEIPSDVQFYDVEIDPEGLVAYVLD